MAGRGADQHALQQVPRRHGVAAEEVLGRAHVLGGERRPRLQAIREAGRRLPVGIGGAGRDAGRRPRSRAAARSGRGLDGGGGGRGRCGRWPAGALRDREVSRQAVRGRGAGGTRPRRRASGEAEGREGEGPPGSGRRPRGGTPCAGLARARALARITPQRGHSGVETSVAPQRGQSMGRAVARERRRHYTSRLSIPDQRERRRGDLVKTASRRERIGSGRTRSRVAVVRTKPETVLDDVGGLMRGLDYARGPAARPADHPEGQHLLAPALPLGEQHAVAARGGRADAARGRLPGPARAPQPDRGHRRAPGRQAQQVRRRLPALRGADGRQLLARLPLGDDRAEGEAARPRPHLRRGARARGHARDERGAPADGQDPRLHHHDRRDEERLRRAPAGEPPLGAHRHPRDAGGPPGDPEGDPPGDVRGDGRHDLRRRGRARGP